MAKAHDSKRAPNADSGHAQYHFIRRAVHFDREKLSVAERPAALGIEFLIEIRLLRRQDFFRIKMIEAEQPVCLIEPVLPHERRRFDCRQVLPLHYGNVRGIVDSLQRCLAVQSLRQKENLPVAFPAGSHDELRRLSGRHKGGRSLEFLPFFLVFPDRVTEKLHRRHDGLLRFLRCQKMERLLRGKLYIDAHPVHVAAKLVQKLRIRSGNAFHMDVPIEMLPFAEKLCRADQKLRRIIRRLHDAG